MALTPKQKQFVAEYLVDLNATAAEEGEPVERWILSKVGKRSGS